MFETAIILIVFGAVLLLAVAFLGVRTYFEYKKLYEESQKIIEEQKKYDAPNFEDSPDSPPRYKDYATRAKRPGVAPGPVVTASPFHQCP